MNKELQEELLLNESDKKLAKQLQEQVRFLVNIIVYKN